MDRPIRRFVPALTFLLVLGGAAWAYRHRPPAPSRPDIVLIVWDTARGDRTQVNGYPLPTTPNLLRLAAEGTTFRQCFTPSPWTPPSHASLFTGLLPRHHGLREEAGDRVRRGIPLLAETLRGAGYETACVVANAHISEATGLDAGFDVRIRCVDSKVPGAVGQDAGARAVEWLDGRRRRRPDRPLFLFVNLMETHIPYSFEAAEVAAVRGEAAVAGAARAAGIVTEEAAGRHLTGIARLDPAIFPDLGAAYDGAVRLADRTTGRILDRLRGDGILDRAVVVVCSDHGENLGEHGAVGHVQSYAEPVLHVPLVIRWPGRFDAGAAVDAQVRLQDVYPTLLEAAGMAVPPGTGRDAVSLLERPVRSRLLVAEGGPSPGRVPAFVRTYPDAPPGVFEPLFRDRLAVRDPSDRPGARKFLSILRITTGGPPTVVREELYDLAADPGEERNLLSGTPTDADREAADRLRALGGR